MPLYVNTNVSSLNAQRQLINSGNQLDQAFERLSSGFRINSAADDAAGLQISNRLGAQIEGLNQGNRNANDGISVAQTAEGALQESSSILQRMRTLAIQSENGLNGAEDKAAIQKEIGVLQDELTRIAETTSFGGEKLLDSNKQKTFQVGANANETISFGLQATRASDLGNNQVTGIFADGTSVTTAAAGGTSASDPVTNALSIQIDDGDNSETYAPATAGLSAKDIADGINDLGTNVTATATNFAKITNFSVTGNESVDLNGETITFDGGETLEEAAELINNFASKTSVRAEVVGSEMRLTSTDGSDIEFSNGNTAAAGDGIKFTIESTDSNFTGTGNSGTFDSTLGTAADVSGVLVKGDVELSSSGSFTITGDGTEATSANSSLSSVQGINVTDTGGGQDAIGVIDAAIAQIDSFRADLGAAQNRFQATVRNQANISENLSEAQSRIKDADFASETAKLTQAQILQQASQTILAQANQRPQAALSLLG